MTSPLRRSVPAHSLRAKPSTAVRGASTKVAVTKRPFNWSILNRGLYVVAIVSVVAALHYVVTLVMAQPVARVVVNGEFRQIDKQLIAQQVEPFLGAGFVKLDLDGIRERLEAQPWVASIEVSRQWPNQIAIHVEEQAVIARWGDQGFLNHRGELFMPAHTNYQWIDTEALPLLHGPEHSSELVMNYFRELSDALSQQGLVLSELTLNDRGGWRARLKTGTTILLGSAEVMAKMRRFLTAYRSVLAENFSRAQAVDMRYSRGFAVSWRDEGQRT